MIDAVTKKRIRNASDEKAAANGCRFDEERAFHPVEFARKYLRLYEGDQFSGLPLEPVNWQLDAVPRLFGWVKYSARLKRWVRRFKQAVFFVPKKNMKSPTVAWLALYLLCADGEQGQKVYLAAVDGGQAREMVGKHVVEMALASEPLMAECSYNKTLMQLTHLPTRSVLKPISSDDSRAAKAKEGLNGCILVDEIHVVDAEFMGRVSRAGISRSEPLQIEVSTAGDDPEGYGRQRYEWGKQVESGAVEDERLLFVCYEAPQDLSDDDLAQDPAKYGRLANPSWGHTVHEEEFLQDYHASKMSLLELGRFKKYRLNIWQQVANPWLNMTDWGKCRREYAEADLLGRDCYGGLDLAKTRDTTALVLCFPEGDGTYRLWAHHWLPEERAKALRDKVPYLEWARQGWLTLTPGGVCEYAFVRKQLNAVKDKFNLLKLAYDDTYAAQLVQRLEEEDGWPTGPEGGICESFRQTVMNFAGPTAAFERLVIDGKIYHPGNPLLTWQVGNTTVKSDANENIRPVKQQHGDLRTIDGSVAGIMGLAEAQKYEMVAAPSVSWI